VVSGFTLAHQRELQQTNRDSQGKFWSEMVQSRSKISVSPIPKKNESKRIPELKGGATFFDKSFGKFSVDIDVGGTFTDVIVTRRNFMKFFKVDTSPNHLAHCFYEVFRKAVGVLDLPDLRTFLSQVKVIRLSTSLSVNSLLERKGARIGLLLNKGWKKRYLAQEITMSSENPILSEDMVMEVEVGKNWEAPAQEEDVRQKSFSLLEKGASIIVVSLENADRSSSDELQVQSIIRKYYPWHFIGSVPVLTGGQMGLGSNYIERTNAAALNAYCHEGIADQLFQIEDLLRDEGYTLPLLIIHCGGGSARVSKSYPVHTISSGAAAGVFGALRMSKTYSRPAIVTVDIGGTSTDIGLIHNRDIQYPPHTHLEGLRVDISSPVAATMGIGGGSIVGINKSGEISLGPESAGAFPGPACYDLGGTEPTLTDVYLILGYLNDDYFLGGQKRIRKDITQKVLQEKIGAPLGISCEDAAIEVKRKAVEVIGEEIRSLIAGSNMNPSGISLFAVGGGGGCIGVDILDFVGFAEALFFRQGPVFGAFGSSGMEVMHTYEKWLDTPLAGKSLSAQQICRELNSTVLSLQRKAFRDMSGEGFRPEEIRFQLDVEVSTASSGPKERIALSEPFIWPTRDWLSIQEKLRRPFKTDKRSDSHSCARITRAFLKALVPISDSNGEHFPRRSTSTSSRKGKRPVYLGQGKWVAADIYEWDFISVPQTIQGPCVIESQDSTIVVPAEKTIRFDANLNGIIKADLSRQ
jgi:N-methylhydantoinase A/oxoprolinase/acetone carboxylase beta subunit